MKTLLRSCFIGSGGDNKDLALRNFQVMNEADLDFDQDEDRLIWHEIREFVVRHGHIPDQQTLRTTFTQKKELSARDRVDELASIPALYGGDFHVWMESRADERRTWHTVEILKNAGAIVSTGLDIKEGRNTRRVHGPVEAIKYILDASHDIMAPTLGTRLSGEVTRDGADFCKRYSRVAADPLAGVGQHTGITQMDVALNGAKRWELWIHAAYTGGMKSSLALNWLYNQAIYYQRSGILFSLEMPYDQCRNILYSMHSFHEKFRLIRYWLGIQKSVTADVGLAYKEIRDGELSPEGYRFLFDFVVPDFNGNPVDVNHHPDTGEPFLLAGGGQMYADKWPRVVDGENVYFDMPSPVTYGKIHIEVGDPDKADFTMADLRHKAETIYGKEPFHMIVIDHVGLMAPRKWVSSTTDRLNEIIRDCKRLAMSFNRGQGIAVVALFQINREGYKAALKRKEKTGVASFDLTHLSYANEAERCVMISGTYTRTKAGFVPIGSISPHTYTQVWSSSGWQDVLQRFDNGTRRIWELTTDRGSVLGCTAPHRVRVLEDGSLGWKAVKDIAPGKDFVVSSFGSPDAWPTEPPSLPCLDIQAYEKASGDQGILITTPEKLTPELSYLLGAWDGDGKVHPQGLSWTGNRKEVAVRDRIRQAFQVTFSHTLPLWESPSRPGSFDLTKWSQPLKRWFEGIAGGRGAAIPEVILKAPRELVLAYLQGLFDTDGWVNNQNVIGIKMKGACMGFIRDVQMLLTALGIDSSITSGETILKVTGQMHTWVSLNILTRVGRERFLSEIGFTESWKQSRLSVSVTDHKESPCRGGAQMYPVPQTFLSAFRKIHPVGASQTEFPRAFYNLPNRVKKTGLVPRGAVETLTAYADAHGITGEDIDFLRGLLSLQVMRVKSVVDTGRDEPVMDLEVTGDHEYQTGPVLSHNSADIVTASWMDDDLSKANRVQFQCLKSRDQKPFEMLWSRVEWACRRILTCWDTTPGEIKSTRTNADDDLDGVL